MLDILYLIFFFSKIYTFYMKIEEVAFIVKKTKQTKTICYD